MSREIIPSDRIINFDPYWSNKVDAKLFKNPLTEGDFVYRDKFDDPLAEIVGLCYYSMPWACKYILGTEVASYQMAFLNFLFSKKYPLLLASRGGSKTFTLGIYALLKALFYQGSKIIIISATFRQAKRVFEEAENAYKRAPLLRAAINTTPRHSSDVWSLSLGESVIKALPLGTGDKIRGERASCVIVDEIDSVDAEVLNVVVRGFAATQMHPMDKLKEASRKARDGVSSGNRVSGQGNQIILAGTAGFTDGNLHKLFVQYSKVIDHKVCGKGYKYKEEIGEDLGDVYIDWKDYGVVRMPWYKIPVGILDIDLISNARLTMSTLLFNMEYGCEFADTSRGFFSFNAIKRATAREEETFNVAVKGDPRKQYVLGLDPARTGDAFGMVILEVGRPNKIVFCYTTINEIFSNNVDKIRELLKIFNIVRIGMDAGGGGLTVEEMLQTSKYLAEGDKAIWRTDDPEQHKPGLYILNMINFAPKWIEEANFLLQKDIEDRNILFPSRAIEYGEGISIDEMDNAVEEIEECKKELCQISVSQTPHGIRQFDITPSLESKKRKLRPRKDRYSALLIANYVANQYLQEIAGDKNPKKFAQKSWDNLKGGWAENVKTY